jgi:hypothetical protein
MEGNTQDGISHVSKSPTRGHLLFRTSTASDDWAKQIMDIMKEQFGHKPKEQSYIYRRLYPDWFDKESLPPQYRVLDFTKFSSSENVSTIEHISCFLTYCGEASIEVSQVWIDLRLVRVIAT